MELQFRNGALISKWSFDFNLKGFSRDLLYRKEAHDLSARVLVLVHSPVFIVAEGVHWLTREENGRMER